MAYLVTPMVTLGAGRANTGGKVWRGANEAEEGKISIITVTGTVWWDGQRAGGWEIGGRGTDGRWHSGATSWRSSPPPICSPGLLIWRGEEWKEERRAAVTQAPSRKVSPSWLTVKSRDRCDQAESLSRGYSANDGSNERWKTSWRGVTQRGTAPPAPLTKTSVPADKYVLCDFWAEWIPPARCLNLRGSTVDWRARSMHVY